MHSLLRTHFVPRLLRNSLAIALVSLVLPLATPGLAESVLLAGGEKEGAASEPAECLAEAAEQREVRSRETLPHQTLRFAANQTLGRCRSNAAGRQGKGHRLPSGQLAPQRC